MKPAETWALSKQWTPAWHGRLAHAVEPGGLSLGGTGGARAGSRSAGGALPVIPGGQTQEKEAGPSMQRPSLQGLGLQSSTSTWHRSPLNPSGHTHRYSPLPAGRPALVTQDAPFRHSQESTDTCRRRGEKQVSRPAGERDAPRGPDTRANSGAEPSGSRACSW
ncbi:hypothetical protein EYF80_043660 [Liparis tanakae]|uniref:Uncharacterized protein n=1 Tax=Liparis tanakae TaxID=230148 RepID=A0A4Z2FZ82_9TELE|nr:hypothetical protein EYF80_043660 [Liparis tanakae]